jgi:AraC-like DNA-binding protein
MPGGFMADSYSIINPKQVNYMHLKGEIIPIDFHLHDGFEIYFLISGDVNYFVEKKVYPLNYGDLIITNSYEVHKPSFQSGKVYERIILQFKAELPEIFSLPQFYLLNCFMNRPLGSRNKISLNKNQLEEFLILLNRIENASNFNFPGDEILQLTSFIELLVFVNRAFEDIQLVEEYPNVPEKLVPILDYIDNNLDSELSLELFENNFYINKFYLCRLFKESTGINIHEYVTFKRISKAKKLLSIGLNVTDSCMMSGFIDYSNFIRVFKKIVGISPGQYKKSVTN